MTKELREIVVMTLSAAAIAIAMIALEILFNGFGTFLMQFVGIFTLAKILTKLLLEGINEND